MARLLNLLVCVSRCVQRQKHPACTRSLCLHPLHGAVVELGCGACQVVLVVAGLLRGGWS
jgi:hypothetical protein